ncbi:hypothetical protein DSM112329_00816 [Paraconexibacter sp. AEG42_29]|uniref:PqqD family protein n=1 Tax=Paraconexibacter sp. AEG42_29 TaxID=2997339 RepID=A0AAU7AQM5_9ACTN
MTIGYERSPDAYAVEMDGEYVMMGQEQGAYFALKGVAAVVWEQLESPQTLDELVNAVVDRFEVSRKDCERDTSAFLAQLLESGLIIGTREK